MQLRLSRVLREGALGGRGIIARQLDIVAESEIMPAAKEPTTTQCVVAEFVGTYLLVLTIGSAGRYALTDLLWLSRLHTKLLRQMYQHMRVFQEYRTCVCYGDHSAFRIMIFVERLNFHILNIFAESFWEVQR